ncbi:AAA family ATPase [Pseudomonas sp. MPFS]|uniref:KAP family P-loop NTPase fold protein n=1 Tax=Pseudomonas sp. MPFS TaxID=2795724 RepID=UPI001F129DA2|nr:P-loop NTPase fold protein [Pseudomonas sp. MPFS]UMZ14910.1 AAA family ATPase [Pseudomonas sp. MPFS]
MSTIQNASVSGGNDAPLTHRQDDLLDRWPLAKLIHRVITSTPPDWSSRIGLYGQWGSGKTSVLNFLQQIAEEKGDIVIRFPVWRTNGEDGFLARFYLELTQALQGEGLAEPLRPWLRRLSQKVSHIAAKATDTVAQAQLPDSLEYGQVITAAAKVSGVVFDKLGSMLQLKEEDLEALHRQLGARRVIVFIDDLDRADPKILPETLLALRELLDWPGFVFVLAFDHELISRALCSYSEAFGESAQHFLDKIIDVPFALPAPTAKQTEKMVMKNLQACCGFLPATTIERCAQWFPGNPRQAKRICRSLSVFGAAAERHNEGDLDWHGIVLQTLLRELEPRMLDHFNQHTQVLFNAFGPSMLGGPNEEEREQQRQAALATSRFDPEGPLAQRSLQLFEAFVLARRDSQSGPEKIDYEMSLATLVPAFTLREFALFFDSWLEHRSKGVIDEFIHQAIDRSGETERLVIRDMLNAANIQYGQLHRAAGACYSRSAFESAADKCLALLELMEWFYGEGASETIRAVCREPEACLAAIRTFFDFLSLDDTELDRNIRQREWCLAQRIAANCDEPNQIHFAIQTQFRQLISYGRQDFEARDQYLDKVTQAVVPTLVSRAIELFFCPNGIANSLFTENSKYQWLLSGKSSPLYESTAAIELLETRMQASRDARQNAVLADNASAYLSYFELGDSFIQPLLHYSAATHGRYVQLSWQALTQVEPRVQVLVRLRNLRHNLLTVGVAESLLPIPAWWAGREGDLEHEQLGL